MRHVVARGRLLVVLAASIAATFAPATAFAAIAPEDHRPCVSKGELARLLAGGTVRKYEIETAWEVRGLGVRMLENPLDRGGSFVTAYPACGYGPKVRVAVKYTWWLEWRYAWLYDDREV